jgi:hypothetical protein
MGSETERKEFTVKYIYEFTFVVSVSYYRSGEYTGNIKLRV